MLLPATPTLTDDGRGVLRGQDRPVTRLLIRCPLELVDRCISLRAKHWESRLVELNGKQALQQNAGEQAISMCRYQSHANRQSNKGQYIQLVLMGFTVLAFDQGVDLHLV